jgi:putative transposase
MEAGNPWAGDEDVTGRATMTKRHNPEQISDVLRRMEAALATGKPVTEASQDCGISLATYYLWRRDYGGMKPDQVERVMRLTEENKRLHRQNADLRIDKAILQVVLSERLMGPAQKRHAVRCVQQALGVSERRACAALALSRSSHRYRHSTRKPPEPLVAALRHLREKYPQYGYRRLAALLRAEGWSVSDISIYRLLRRKDDSASQ